MKTLLALTFALLVLTPSLRADTIASSSSQPTIGALDVYSYITPNGSYDGGRDYTNNGYNGGSGNPGQTFTLATSGLLTALTIEGGGGAGLGYQTGTFDVDIYSVGTDGTSLTFLGGQNFSFASTTADYSTDYLTFNFTTPITLTAGQQYAFSVEGTQGYYQLGGSETQTTPENVGGAAINTNGDPSISPSSSTDITDSLSYNRNFDAHIEALPEPSTYALMGLGLLAFVAIRRARAVRA